MWLLWLYEIRIWLKLLWIRGCAIAAQKSGTCLKPLNELIWNSQFSWKIWIPEEPGSNPYFSIQSGTHSKQFANATPWTCRQVDYIPPPFPWNIAQRLETTPAWQTREFNLKTMLNWCELKWLKSAEPCLSCWEFEVSSSRKRHIRLQANVLTGNYNMSNELPILVNAFNDPNIKVRLYQIR